MIYAVGTLAAWLGIAALLTALASCFRRNWRRAWASGLLAGLGWMISGLLPMTPDSRVAPGSGWSLPVVWLTMNVWGWMVAFCGVGLLIRFGQALSSWRQRHRPVWGWLGCTLASIALAGHFGIEANLLKGRISAAPLSWLGGLMWVIVGMLIFAWAGRTPQGARWSRGLATHAALVLGSILFSIPLFWLLLTSFREDRDTNMADGFRWWPRVMVTTEHVDPKNPYLEMSYRGQRVEGFLLEGNPAQVRIERPSIMRGLTVPHNAANSRTISQRVPVVTGEYEGQLFEGKVVRSRPDGLQEILILSPASLAQKEIVLSPGNTQPVWRSGPKWSNYSAATEYLPLESERGLLYLRNTLFLVVMTVIGTVLSCSIVAYGFARVRFFAKNFWYALLLATMMLPGAVTLLPSFLIFRELGWIDTLLPLWVPAFFAGAFNVFLLRQFFSSIPMELEDAARVDGCTILQTFWRIMMPQIKPALTVVSIWTFMGTWNNFMGPLIYTNSPEKMTVAYALQLFLGDHSAEPTLMMAFATMAMLPVLIVFFAAQKYFIEGVTLSGLGGR